MLTGLLHRAQQPFFHKHKLDTQQRNLTNFTNPNARVTNILEKRHRPKQQPIIQPLTTKTIIKLLSNNVIPHPIHNIHYKLINNRIKKSIYVILLTRINIIHCQVT